LGTPRPQPLSAARSRALFVRRYPHGHRAEKGHAAMNTRIRLSLLVFFLSFLSCTKDASAHPKGPNARYVVSVEDESGRELPTFHYAGQTFVMGRFGERYNVRVENHTGRRVEAVVTVDGRDVVSGSVGDFVHERGYLIDAYDQVLIEGFRQNWSEVAAFRFTNPGNSYSARMGTPENVGVIGVAVFPERIREVVARTPVRPQKIAPAAPAESRDDRARAPSAARSSGAASGLGTMSGADSERKREAAAPMPSASTDNLGTAYGESVASSVTETAFERANRGRPAEIIALRYDDHDGLVARGIAVDPPAPRAFRGPDAFPRNHRFAPPPPQPQPMWD
jgi:hypothetical protein